jgi:hypothetical protein
LIGGDRDRGNHFLVHQRTALREIELHLDISSSTDLYFFVYEGSGVTGNYTRIHQTHIAESGTGLGWYSSGPIDVQLSAGKYYYIGAAWENTATYGWGDDSGPLSASFGQLLSGGGWTIAGYPPPPSIFGFDASPSMPPYYMRLTTCQAGPTATPSATPTNTPTSTPCSCDSQCSCDGYCSCDPHSCSCNPQTYYHCTCNPQSYYYCTCNPQTYWW